MSPASTSLREQQRAFTRDRLLEAAQECFGELGYVDTTVENIAKRAGASRATFYLHFRSKADVMTALLDKSEQWAVDRYRTLDEILSDEEGRQRPALEEWLSGWLTYWRDDSDLCAAVMQAETIDREVVERKIHRSGELIDAVRSYLDGRPKSQRAEARQRALLLEIMTQRILHLASRRDLPVDDAVLISFLTDIWSAQFLPSP
jgi:AcrR family transcriptional regulator